MSETTPEQPAEDVETEDVEPLTDDEMTDAQPPQPNSQDDPALGAPPEVTDDDGDDDA